MGHFRSQGVPLKRKLKEFPVAEDELLPVGTQITVHHFVPVPGAKAFRYLASDFCSIKFDTRPFFFHSIILIFEELHVIIIGSTRKLQAIYQIMVFLF